MRKALIALWLALILLLGGCASAVKPLSGVGYYFNTVVTLTLQEAKPDLMTRLWQECGRYERLLSKTVPGSDVERLNRAQGQPVAVDGETYALLARAKELSALTGGAFSVTIAPLSALWDFTGGTRRVPTVEERLAALPLVDDSRIILGEDGTVTLPPGVQIDLGGVAKGYIADRLAAMVREAGARGTLNIGGNVYVVGGDDGGGGIAVGIADPQSPGTPIAQVSAADSSVVTSGTYQRCFTKDGKTYHHILDPATGLPADSGVVSATVVSPSSADADALATACVVLGAQRAIPLMEELGMDAILVDAKGHIMTTQGTAERCALRLR